MNVTDAGRLPLLLVKVAVMLAGCYCEGGKSALAAD